MFEVNEILKKIGPLAMDYSAGFFIFSSFCVKFDDFFYLLSVSSLYLCLLVYMHAEGL
jgi:hypothetical protein